MIQRMIDVRIDHDESQRQLAAAIGYNQVQIARYETGRNTPPIAYLVKFCQHYHVARTIFWGCRARQSGRGNRDTDGR